MTTKLSTTRPRHSAAAAADSDYFSKTGKGPRHAVPRNSFISCAMNESDNRGRICKCLHELYCYHYGTYAIDLAIEWAGKRVVCSLFLRVLKLLIIKKFEKRIVSEVFKVCCAVEKLENALVKHVLTLHLHFKKFRGSKRFFDSKFEYHISWHKKVWSMPVRFAERWPQCHPAL